MGFNPGNKFKKCPRPHKALRSRPRRRPRPRKGVDTGLHRDSFGRPVGIAPAQRVEDAEGA